MHFRSPYQIPVPWQILSYGIAKIASITMYKKSSYKSESKKLILKFSMNVLLSFLTDKKTVNFSMFI